MLAAFDLTTTALRGPAGTVSAMATDDTTESAQNTTDSEAAASVTESSFAVAKQHDPDAA